jgi:hypothetical protein
MTVLSHRAHEVCTLTSRCREALSAAVGLSSLLQSPTLCHRQHLPIPIDMIGDSEEAVSSYVGFNDRLCDVSVSQKTTAMPTTNG